MLTCQFSRDGLGGHLLATGDEQGQVLLMDTRKRAKKSVVEGISNEKHFSKNYSILLHIEIVNWFTLLGFSLALCGYFILQVFEA